MKVVNAATILVLLFSCTGKNDSSDEEKNSLTEQEITVPELQSILDSADVKGSILIYDFQEKVYYSNDFEWARRGYLPASTFKIPNSIIALETGVVENDSILFKWDEERRSIKSWEQDLILKDAFHVSCVPCYQEVARKIGEERMVEYLAKLNYDNMKVDASNLDLFWLQGDSRISQFQQINFLKRFYQSELPISGRTKEIMKRLMVIEEVGDYILSGKTGWTVSDEINNGWFVGYIESQGKVYFFATNVEPGEQFNMDLFPMIRKEVSYKAFKQLHII